MSSRTRFGSQASPDGGRADRQGELESRRRSTTALIHRCRARWLALLLCVATGPGPASAAAPSPAGSRAAESAAWVVRELSNPLDEEGDTRVSGLVTTQEEGHRLELLALPDRTVALVFRLAPRELDILDLTQPFALGFDDRPPTHLPPLGGGLQWLAVRVWDGAGEGLTGTLRELMQSDRLTVRYALGGGGYKTAHFDTAGSGGPIAEAFGLRSQVTAEELEAARERERVIAEEAIRCSALKKKKQEICVEKARRCMTEARDALSLRECLGGVREGVRTQ